ncbi:TonB-dependent receptor [Exilibacterium tricleocarpae]|uniref:TonB-dependent receptor n=1 Tax=Exilibacterium tricleocarpae TaxID=2591008 RepID=A0A545SSS7_9GAMM|nr:TonB-dependent receptor [Exilibacterium tricleocarpae]TQV68024.1 TonB-dependent receptor [Exilibacterium tricleocarpae]
MKTRSSGNPMKIAALALAVSAASSGAWAEGERQYFDIQTDKVGEALKAFAVQSDSEILFAAAVVSNKKTAGLTGEYTEEEALEKILEGTGLEANRTKENVFLVQANPIKKKPLINSNQTSTSPTEIKSSFVEKSKVLEEITVTASKRGAQDLQSLDSSISVLTKEDIENKSLVGMQDYLPTVPGVSLLDLGAGSNILVIRGLATSFAQQPTSSIYLGEIPLGNPTSQVGSDIKLVDIERVEVLRGPQGTLYGSGALSGAVRNIPVAPSLEKIEGNLKAGLSRTDGSGDSNYRTEAAFNLPLIENELALRLVGYHFENAGYVDMVTDQTVEDASARFGAPVDTRGKNLGDSTYTGGRASLLWQPSDKLEMTFIAGTQKVDEDDRVGTINPRLDGYVATRLVGPSNFTEDKQSYINLTVKYDLGWASLTSSSSKSEEEANRGHNRSRDLSTPWPLFGTIEDESDWFVQEIRLASQFSGDLQFVGGLFYEDFQYDRDARLRWTSDPALIPGFLGEPDNVQTVIGSRDFEQQAVFGEVYYNLSEQWQLTLGGRWFDYDRRDVETSSGGLASSPFDVDAGEQDTIYKASLAFTPNEDSLIYAQYSEGFRLGKGQTIPSANICDVNGDGLLDNTDTPLDPGAIMADNTKNFELGTKLTLLDSRVNINATIYRIDWQDLPIRIRSTTELCGRGTSVEVNGGEARSQGLEFETTYFASQDLLLNLSASYTDTELLDDTIGAKGERLLYTPRTNANLGVQYNFELSEYASFLRTDLGYVGDYKTDLAGRRENSGDYVKLALRAGISLKQFDIEVYGTNLTNEDEVVTNFDRWGFRVPPRIVGMDIRYHF